MTRRHFRLSITGLAHFCCRWGDLAYGQERTPTAQQGMEGHQRLQAQRPLLYQREVSIKTSVEARHCSWVLAGRLDGLQPDYQQQNNTLLEEIKTTYYTDATLPRPQYDVHLAQARLYGALLCQQQNLNTLTLRLTYLNLEDNTTFQREQDVSATELTGFLQDCLQQYSDWLDQYCQYLDQRDQSLQTEPFPFADYRSGQRALSITVYRNIRDQQNGIYHAPTGLGKTMGFLYPTLKQLGEGNIRQIWYLTAKNSGHNSVRQALELLSPQLAIRALFLQAREKLCPGCSSGEPEGCTFQKGYFDRLPAARRAFQQRRRFLHQDLVDLAHEHTLCAHQLGRDLLPWMDVVIADYNYVFDPYTRLGDALENSKNLCLLVDEAHNLPDRARLMFSAELPQACLRQLQNAVTVAPLQKRLRSIERQIGSLIRSTEPQTLSSKLCQLLTNTAEALNEWFAQQNWLLYPGDLFEQVMTLWRFAQRANHLQAEDVILCSQQPDRIQIYCTDPSTQLERLYQSFHSCHFFSGSLLPLDYFQRSISTQPLATRLQLASPFPGQHLCTLIAPVNTRYQYRQQSMDQIVALLNAMWQARPGRYLMALPSYEYLQEVMSVLEQTSTIPLQCQPNSSDPLTRQAFHDLLQEPNYLAGVIAGGLFAEGLDLGSTKLDGVIIIGTCMPPPSQEREQIKNHFSSLQLDGFDFAYRYPGINRVIQSAGRLIRSEQDRGLVLLMDDRFHQPRYRQLMPDHWQPKLVKNPQELNVALTAFYRTDV